MADTNVKNKSLQEKLSDKYRIVVIDDDTLGEVKSLKVSAISVILTIAFAFMLVGLLSAAIISFTPLKYLVPGYADVTNNKTYMDLTQKLEAIEQELDAQRYYTNGLKNMLNPSDIKATEDDSTQQKLDNSLIGSTNLKGSAELISMEQFYFTSPLNGEISAAFDLDNKHFGVDITAEKNSPVKSILDGIVITSDWSVKTGNTISIQHRNNVISVYKHNSTLLKNIGETVQSGEAIAIIGNTGILTNGPHVHFELWNNGIPVNPEHYINFK